jgi:2-oxoisovalerate dehydrogenase E2 component (dihydrolipoyl transacylase)
MPQEFHMPDIGEGLTEAEIIKWFVDVGDTVEIDQILVEVETAKTVVEIPSPFAGTITSILASEGETVDVDAVLFVIDGDTPLEALSPDARDVDQSGPERGRPEGPGTATASTATASTPTPAAAGPKAMPVIRKLARERGIDLAMVIGTGPGGAITRSDLEKGPRDSTETPDVKPLSRTRQTIAQHMAESWRTIPHVTVQAEVRSEALMRARTNKSKPPTPIEVLIAQAVIPLLLAHPEFNSAYVDGGMAIKPAIDLGFAVDTEAGLIVVVVTGADQLSVSELTAEFERLAAAAQHRTITLEEITGQTFTISNIGALGGGHGTPIIPPGTSSIVSIGRAKEQAVVEDGELAVGLVAPLDLSYDHRLIDGGLGQRFLGDLVKNLETIG